MTGFLALEAGNGLTLLTRVDARVLWRLSRTREHGGFIEIALDLEASAPP